MELERAAEARRAVVASVCLNRKMNFVIFQKKAISMGIWSKTCANPIENCKQLNNTLKNSKGRQIHLFYLSTLGRISKPELSTS